MSLNPPRYGLASMFFRSMCTDKTFGSLVESSHTSIVTWDPFFRDLLPGLTGGVEGALVLPSGGDGEAILWISRLRIQCPLHEQTTSTFGESESFEGWPRMFGRLVNTPQPSRGAHLECVMFWRDIGCGVERWTFDCHHLRTRELVDIGKLEPVYICVKISELEARIIEICGGCPHKSKPQIGVHGSVRSPKSVEKIIENNFHAARHVVDVFLQGIVDSDQT